MGKSKGITHSGHTNAVAVKFEPLQTTKTGQPARARKNSKGATTTNKVVKKVLGNWVKIVRLFVRIRVYSIDSEANKHIAQSAKDYRTCKQPKTFFAPF